MNAKPMTFASTLALGVALAASGASAQTVISRTVTTVPVETVVTQTPTGTVVTRRPVEAAGPRAALAPAVGVATAPAPTAGAAARRGPPSAGGGVAPGPPAATVVETVPDTVDAITTREVVRRAEVTRRTPALVTRAVSARPDPRLPRNVGRNT